MRVRVVDGDEGGILFLDEGIGGVVCPELILFRFVNKRKKGEIPYTPNLNAVPSKPSAPPSNVLESPPSYTSDV
jgi:hypothetical protein